MRRNFNLLLIAFLFAVSGLAGAQETATKGGTIVGPGEPVDPSTGWTIGVECGAGGSISPAGTDGKLEVKPGADQTFTITAEGDSRIASVKVDGVEKLTATDVALITYSHTFKNVSDNTHTIQAAFTTNRFTLTGTAGKGGTISPTTVQVTQGGNQLFTITPKEGYEIADVKADGVSAGAVSTYLYRNVTKAGTIEASFKGREHTVTVSEATHGTFTVSPLTNGKATYGTTLTLDAVPETGYMVEQITANGLRLTGNSYRLTGDVTLAATFKKATHVVTVNASSAGGSLTVKKGGTALLTGTHQVEYGTELVLENKPATGHGFTEYKVSPSSALNGGKITVTGNVSVEAVFAPLTFKVAITAPETSEGTLKVAGKAASTGEQEYPYNTELILGNEPAAGKQFESYVVNPASALSGNKLKVTGDVSLSVRFKPTTGAGEGTDPEGQKIYAVTFASPLIVKEGETNLASGTKVKKGTVLSLIVPNSNTQRLVSLTAEGNPIDFLSSNGVNTAIYVMAEAPVQLVAGFVRNTFPVSVLSPEGGTLQVTAGGNPVISGNAYDYGTVIQVAATPSEGYSLSHILAGRQDITLSKRVTLTEDLLLSAVFTAKDAIAPNPDPSDPDPNAPTGIDLTPQSVVYNGKAQAFAVKTSPGGILDKVTVAYKQGGQNATPLKAGLYDVVLTRPADDRFAALNQAIPGGLEIRKALVSVISVDYKEEQLVGNLKRTTATLTGGKTEYLGKEVTGSFAWADPKAVGNQLTVENSGYQEVRFTPNDKDNYQTAVARVYIQVGDVPSPTYRVTLQKEGEGSVSFHSGDLACPPSGPFHDGMSLTLKATPAEGYRFAGYRIEGILYNTNVHTFNVTKDVTVTAIFAGKEDPAKPSDPSDPSSLKVTLTFAPSLVYDGIAKLVGVSSQPTLSGWQVEYLDKDKKAVIPVNAGTYQVIVTRAEDDRYLAYEQSSSFTITKATPIISTLPVSGTIPSGALLEDAVLSGGMATAVGLGVVPGTFHWNNPQTPITSNRVESFRFTPIDVRNFFSVSGECGVQMMDAAPPVRIVYNQPSGGKLSVTREGSSDRLSSGSLIPFGTQIRIEVTANTSYKFESLYIGAADYTADAINGQGTVVRQMHTSQQIAAGFVRISNPGPDPIPGPDPDPNPNPNPDPDPNPGPDPDPNPDPDPTPGDYTVWVRSTGLGTVSPETSQVKWGDRLIFTVTPGIGQQLVDVRLNGNSVGAVNSYTLSNIQADASIEAIFSQPGIPVHTLTSKVEGKGGSVTPTVVRVTEGSNHRFILQKEGKGEIVDVKVGDAKGLKSVGKHTSYLFRDVKADSLIVATFAIPTAIEEVTSAQVAKITSGNGYIQVTPLRGPIVLSLYGVNGQLAFRQRISAGTTVNSLTTGIYLIELCGEGYIAKEKVFVKNGQ